MSDTEEPKTKKAKRVRVITPEEHQKNKLLLKWVVAEMELIKIEKELIRGRKKELRLKKRRKNDKMEIRLKRRKIRLYYFV